MRRLSRREWLAALAGAGAFLASGAHEVDGSQRRRPVRRRTRRRVRRRIRRVAVRRTVLGRPVWVVPIGLAVGWELALENRVVVVKEIKAVEKSGSKVQVAVVQDGSGKLEEFEILREDTAENRKDLAGSVLPDDDKTTPRVEDEIEEP